MARKQAIKRRFEHWRKQIASISEYMDKHGCKPFENLDQQDFYEVDNLFKTIRESSNAIGELIEAQKVRKANFLNLILFNSPDMSKLFERQRNKRKKEFFDNSIQEMSKNYLDLIGEHSNIFLPLAVFLSCLNIAASFMFFYKPIFQITDSYFFAVLLSVIFLTLIEIISFTSYYIGLKASLQIRWFGFIIVFFSLFILAWNVYFSAIGNKELVQVIETKPDDLKQTLLDSLKTIEKNYNYIISNSENQYQDKLTEINNFYTNRLNKINQDISESQDMKNPGDWTKYYNSINDRSKDYENWNKEKDQEFNRRIRLQTEAKTKRDSMYILVNRDLKNRITIATDDKENHSNIAFWIGIVIVSLLVIVRSVWITSKYVVFRNAKKLSEKYMPKTRQISRQEKELLRSFLNESNENDGLKAWEQRQNDLLTNLSK